MEQLGSNCTDFREIWHENFRKSVKKVRVLLHSDKKKRAFYTKTYVHLWYLAEFFLEWEMFQTKVVEKIKTHILCSVICFIFFFPKLCRLWDNVEKYGTAGQATYDNMAHAHCTLYT